jgi:hypothetical protein
MYVFTLFHRALCVLQEWWCSVMMNLVCLLTALGILTPQGPLILRFLVLIIGHVCSARIRTIILCFDIVKNVIR